MPDLASTREYLEAVAELGRGRYARPTTEAFVLEHGRPCEPRERPPELPLGQPKFCFANAFHHATPGSPWTYCEGFAHNGYFPTHHAWLLDAEGKAIEVTWPEPAAEYFGIPVPSLLLTQVAVKTGQYGVLPFGMDELAAELVA